MPINWSFNTQEEANAALPQNNLEEGRYWGTVTKAEIIIGGRPKTDGTYTKDFLKLNIKVELNPGVAFADASLFDSEHFFHMRKHFWESANEEHQIRNTDERVYIGRRVQFDAKVESYTANNGQEKKKLVIVDFIGNSKKQEASIETGEPKIDAAPFIEDEIPF
jgi:hypothetical protein